MYAEFDSDYCKQTKAGEKDKYIIRVYTKKRIFKEGLWYRERKFLVFENEKDCKTVRDYLFKMVGRLVFLNEKKMNFKIQTGVYDG